MSLQIKAFGKTDLGRKRTGNEDAYLVDSENGFHFVADGMGGHNAGEVASAKAVEIARAHVLKHKDVLDALAANPTPMSGEAAQKLVEEAIQAASNAVFQMAQDDLAKRGMGTTFVGLFLAGTKAILGHVGDSRVYLFRQGQAHCLTEDHTLIGSQLKAGTITKEEAAKSPYRNVITRAVGIQASVQVDTLLLDLLPGDLYMLCSDGLHGYLRDEEPSLLLGAASASDLPGKLIELANARGGKDNITCVCLSVEGTTNASTREVATEAAAKIEALRKLSLFRHLSYKEQSAIISIAQMRTYPAGREIVIEGQEGNELFVILRGRLVLEKGGKPITELRAGHHFGEMGLIESAPRSATIRAKDPTRVMVIERGDLMTLMRKDPVLAVKLLWSFVQVISERLRLTTREMSKMRQQMLSQYQDDGTSDHGAD
ncbi:MAG: cyclic nucleotide-binding domain-containing protein [Myxococcales bacterium]|jgi:serine/threonine protein phosphatase PrpC|nr:cyclic nucleotide-binding domain-containing protein [Myxococcales bacterium]